MATDRIRIGRRARWWRACGPAAAALLLAGCASMPGSGPVQSVEAERRNEADSQVLVYSVPPEEGMQPVQIVRGFLEAITSDEERFDTAKQYLTPEQAEEWDPFSEITVLSGVPRPSPGGDASRVELSGTQQATVDSSGVYTADEDPYTTSFGLVEVEGEWRIGALPNGLVMGEADFRRIYRSVDTFYYADLGNEAGRVAEGDDVLVADPVYVRRRIDPVGDIVRALLDGPSEWYYPVVTSAFPDGVTLAGDSPVIGESGRLSVSVDGVPGEWSVGRCGRMATQLLFTVQELTPADVSEVRLRDEDGAQLCTVDRGAAERSAPGLLDGEQERSFFLDEESRLVAVPRGNDAAPRAVAGPFGEGTAKLRAVAVSRDVELAAGVGTDGSELYLASVTGSDPELETVLTSASYGPDAGLSAPSFDGLGDLWVADRDPERPRLLRLSGGEGTEREVPVSGLAPGERIEALRVASDGVRIAMLISDGRHTTLHMGRIERTRTREGVTVSVNALREVAPELDEVSAVSWAGDSRLVLVGRSADGVQQVRYMISDGSPANVPAGPGLNDVTAVAASEDESQPLLVETGETIARLEDNAQWRALQDGEAGNAPVYPG
jgi:hypothetical protein